MRTTGQQVEVEKRRGTVASYLVQGLNLTQIADLLGVTKQTISKDAKAIRKEWREDRSQLTTDMVELENARLDRLTAAYFGKAASGDFKAADMVLKIMDRRARLFGLDAPTKTFNAELNVENVPTDLLTRYMESGDPAEIQGFLNASV